MRNSHHLATISFDGRFWDVYLELEETQSPESRARGRIAFSAADEGAGPVRTATIFIEETAQAVLHRARDFKTHQLVALLRSALPEPSGEATSPDPEPRTAAEADIGDAPRSDEGPPA